MRPSTAPRPSRPATRASSRLVSTIRIIGGLWKRTPLPVANLPGLRPTPDRVRETAFNWLTHQCGGSLDGLSALDLFAGTGAMGFEAASRGAVRVVLCEQDGQLIDHLRAIQNKLQAGMIEIQHASALTLAQAAAQAATQGRTSERFDMVFLDPPYHQGWLDKFWPLLPGLLNDNGLIYAEAEAPLEASAMAALGFELLRADKAGQVFYHLLRKTDE